LRFSVISVISGIVVISVIVVIFVTVAARARSGAKRRDKTAGTLNETERFRRDFRTR